jgi:PAS domain-containing protein
MGEKYSKLHSEDAITHGICKKCMDSLSEKKHIDFFPFLNTIPAPVILIDENNTYIAANNKALQKLGKEKQDLSKNRTGDIFVCENAELPGGCGHTENCPGCQMLTLISKTYEERHSFSQVPVSIIRKDGNIKQQLNLELTTENISGMVLMRIDSMYP